MLRWTAAALTVAVCLSLPAAAPQVDAQDVKVNWLTDKSKAFDLAKRTGKPIWILFR